MEVVIWNKYLYTLLQRAELEYVVFFYCGKDDIKEEE